MKHKSIVRFTIALLFIIAGLSETAFAHWRNRHHRHHRRWHHGYYYGYPHYGYPYGYPYGRYDRAAIGVGIAAGAIGAAATAGSESRERRRAERAYEAMQQENIELRKKLEEQPEEGK